MSGIDSDVFFGSVELSLCCKTILYIPHLFRAFPLRTGCLNNLRWHRQIIGNEIFGTQGLPGYP